MGLSSDLRQVVLITGVHFKPRRPKELPSFVSQHMYGERVLALVVLMQAFRHARAHTHTHLCLFTHL